jgi:hypothetical protein
MTEAKVGESVSLGIDISQWERRQSTLATPKPYQCSGAHRFHVADVAVIEFEGAIEVIAICLLCGEFRSHRFQVAKPHSGIALKSSELSGEPINKK